MNVDSWTIERVISWTQVFFEKTCPASPRLDAELLLACVLDCSRLDLYLQADRRLTEAERGAYRELVRKRADGYPLAYLSGEKEFWSLRFEVNEAVLIPRPDTETLVEIASAHIRKRQKAHPREICRIAELGTGSAAIPLALCAELRDLEIVAVDCSPQALAVAFRNLAHHKSLLTPKNNTVKLVEGNKFSRLNSETKYAFIVSNPPYIPTDTIPTLQTEVSQYEPRIALDGGPDGLRFYRYLLENAPRFLKTDGEMILEIGFDQEAILTALAANFPEWTFSKFLPDLQGNIRVWHLRCD